MTQFGTHMLEQIETIERVCEALRRLHGFEERGGEKKNARPRHPCPHCSTTFFGSEELESHLVDWHATKKAKV